jgi:hypothetical protein
MIPTLRLPCIPSIGSFKLKKKTKKLGKAAKSTTKVKFAPYSNGSISTQEVSQGSPIKNLSIQKKRCMPKKKGCWPKARCTNQLMSRKLVLSKKMVHTEKGVGQKNGMEGCVPYKIPTSP